MTLNQQYDKKEERDVDKFLQKDKLMSYNPLFSLADTGGKPCFVLSSRQEFSSNKKNKIPSSLLLGRWEIAGGQHVHLYSLPHRELKAFIYNQQGLLVTEVKESHIRGGIQGQMPSVTLHRMLREIKRTRLAAAQVLSPHKGLQLFFFPKLRAGMEGEEEEEQPPSQALAEFLFNGAKEKEEEYQTCKEAGQDIEAQKALQEAINDYGQLSTISCTRTLQKTISQCLESLKQDQQKYRFKEEEPLYLADTKEESRLLRFLRQSSFDISTFKVLSSITPIGSLQGYFVKAFACEALEQREEAAHYYYQLGELHIKIHNQELAQLQKLAKDQELAEQQELAKDRVAHHQKAAQSCFNKAFCLNPHLLLKSNLKLPDFPKSDAELLPNVKLLSDIELLKAQQILLRLEFEKALEEIRNSQPETPLCFISYAWGLGPKEDVEDWLKDRRENAKPAQEWLIDYLVPDLDQVGVKALFDLRECIPGTNLMDYMQHIASTDTKYVLLICTPSMREKYESGEKHGLFGGIKTELTMLNTRFKKAAYKGSVLCLLYQGEWLQANPLPMTEDTIYIDMRRPDKYYEAFLKLACILKQIPGQINVKVNKFEATTDLLLKTTEVTDQQLAEIEAWKKQQESRPGKLWEPILKKK
ncbi:hypothetical protein DB42_BS00300 [Neochlamydia sp. EPS4]|nr:hypothetical protein DB42_BS00300 [Neochlamydia sp. EPS4]